MKASTWAPVFLLLLTLLITATADVEMPRQWCVADEQTPEEVLQMALDWACGRGGGGANCSMIQPNQPCYLPNTVRDHASYAFNSYYQSSKNRGGSCYFNAAAIVTESDPSHGSCRFEFFP